MVMNEQTTMVLLNKSQLVRRLDTCAETLTRKIESGEIVPDAWTPKGQPLFYAHRLEELRALFNHNVTAMPEIIA